MKNKRVGIKYQYFQIRDTENNLFDLRAWIARINAIPLVARVHEVNGIEGRVERTALVGEEFYAVEFMRLDVISNTYILEANTAARHIDLEDNEYIGRSTILLYDPRNSIAMVQVNRGSYGVAAIQSYINSFLPANQICFFDAIKDEFVENAYLERHYYKLDVRFANVSEFVTERSEQLERIIDTCNDLDCRVAHIEIGVGYNYAREYELDREVISDMIHDIKDERNREHVSSAKVTVSDDTKSMIFDLMSNTCNDTISYLVPERGELGMEVMANRMREKYEEGTRAKIVNILYREE